MKSTLLYWINCVNFIRKIPQASSPALYFLVGAHNTQHTHQQWHIWSRPILAGNLNVLVVLYSVPPGFFFFLRREVPTDADSTAITWGNLPDFPELPLEPHMCHHSPRPGDFNAFEPPGQRFSSGYKKYEAILLWQCHKFTITALKLLIIHISPLTSVI